MGDDWEGLGGEERLDYLLRRHLEDAKRLSTLVLTEMEDGLRPAESKLEIERASWCYKTLSGAGNPVKK
jgi:hypothetical protein